MPVMFSTRMVILFYTMKIPFNYTQVIKKGFCYVLRQDEESGNYRIVRYRIKNYDKMKDGQ